jgi:ADP-ribose pyrophosphatase
MANKDKTAQFPQIGVGAVVFNDKGEVLLVKRRNEPAKNMWTIPGGRLKAGETLKQTAEREIFEETGIKIEANEIIYTFELIEKDDDDNIRFHYIIIDFDARYLSGEVFASDDALEADWISAEILRTIDVNSSTNKLLREKYNFK